MQPHKYQWLLSSYCYGTRHFDKMCGLSCGRNCPVLGQLFPWLGGEMFALPSAGTDPVLDWFHQPTPGPSLPAWGFGAWSGEEQSHSSVTPVAPHVSSPASKIWPKLRFIILKSGPLKKNETWLLKSSSEFRLHSKLTRVVFSCSYLCTVELWKPFLGHQLWARVSSCNLLEEWTKACFRVIMAMKHDASPSLMGSIQPLSC